MTGPTLEPQETGNAVVDHRERAKYFLKRGRQYLADDDLHQASEKGWGAAAHMVKAAAAAGGWSYQNHDEFGDVLDKASALAGERPDSRPRECRELPTWQLLQAQDILEPSVYPA